jgi:hypothetical protein
MKIGTFYEAFDEDALFLHTHLEFNFTTGERTHKKVGTHERGIDELVARLLGMGRKICRVEALETRDQATQRGGTKAAIRRGVRDVLTPGTAVGIERRLGPIQNDGRLDACTVNSIKRYLLPSCTLGSLLAVRVVRLRGGRTNVGGGGEDGEERGGRGVGEAGDDEGEAEGSRGRERRAKRMKRDGSGHGSSNGGGHGSSNGSGHGSSNGGGHGGGNGGGGVGGRRKRKTETKSRAGKAGDADEADESGDAVNGGGASKTRETRGKGSPDAEGWCIGFCWLDCNHGTAVLGCVVDDPFLTRLHTVLDEARPAEVR